MQTLLHDDQLADLARELRPGEGECPFVVRPPHDAIVRLAHFSGGRDATYVLLEALKPATVTIGFAPFVEGTTLIYDVTDQTLQGKARPFTCDLQTVKSRIYALLPVQIEAVHIGRRGERLQIEFRDARAERIAAALPFEWTLIGARDKPALAISSTSRRGQFVRDLGEAVARDLASVIVRSLLTGRVERQPINK
jgi:hypothetical protein